VLGSGLWQPGVGHQLSCFVLVANTFHPGHLLAEMLLQAARPVGWALLKMQVGITCLTQQPSAVVMWIYLKFNGIVLVLCVASAREVGMLC
jgi:hypothetical protein